MSTIWFTTDPHFFHNNILTFLDKNGERIRPFDSIEQMHKIILENHNDVVGDNDKVYWGGDITFKVTPEFIDLFKKFKGKHRWVVGNHDPIPDLIPFFKKVFLWRIFREEGIIPFTFSHIPLHPDCVRGDFMVHGHIHQNIMDDKKYINICPEVRAYEPTSFEQLQTMMQMRSLL